MTWTYSGNPSGSDRDKVRFLISDTDTNAQLVSDEEIAWALTEGGPYKAAAIVARAIAFKYAKKANFTISKDISVSYGKIAETYSALADTLENKAGNLYAVPFAGGISINNKESYENDTDRVEPAFKRDMMNDPTLTSED